MIPDPRATPLRGGWASAALDGLVRARGYLAPRRMVVTRPAASIRAAPDASSEQVDQLLFGETFDLLEEAGGFAWGQARRDGYVGYVEAVALGPAGEAATHRIASIGAYAFTRPDIKAPGRGPYSMNALVRVESLEGPFAAVAGAGWIPARHLSPIGVFESDPAAVAERFIGAPYLWGGRESLGLDCSGLIQQSLFACGRACPRDSDQQAGVGRPIEAGMLRRGDLVFWLGHVAMALDARRVIHANAHHMAVVVEPRAEAVARIAAAGGGEPVGCRRP